MAKLMLQLLVLACVAYMAIASVAIALPNPSNLIYQIHSFFTPFFISILNQYLQYHQNTRVNVSMAKELITLEVIIPKIDA